MRARTAVVLVGVAVLLLAVPFAALAYAFGGLGGLGGFLLPLAGLVGIMAVIGVVVTGRSNGP